MLAAHREHVVIDLSWVVYPDYVPRDIDTWAALIRKYPENKYNRRPRTRP